MGENKVTELWKMYEQGRSYQSQLGLTTQIPVNVDFYEGRQWAAVTEKTKDIPRPMVNITKFIVRNKKASVVGAPVSIVFTSSKNAELAEKLTAFNARIEKEIDMDDIRNNKVQDGIVKGTGVTHYYWDSEARGELGDYDGGVRAEIIEPLDVFFANPQEKDEQKQKWILIASRVEVDAAKAMLDGKYKKNANLVVEDNATALYTDEIEQDGEKLVTVLTRYYKVNGEVFYERGTRATMLHDGRAMTPETRVEDKAEDDAEDKLPDEAKTASARKKKFTLYPISVYNYEPREKSIYGIGEVEGIIPNQKAVNFNLAMQLLSIQNLAWGKYIVKAGALRNQTISNAPGQTIVDYTPNGVKGITRSDDPPISQAPMSYTDTLISMTRVVTGSTEVLTGEQMSSNQSGAAIANLQSQALKPIQELRERYLRSCKKEARIIKQFYEHFYEGAHFEREGKDGVAQDEIFNGREYQNAYFDISVEAGNGTPFSESLSVSLLGEYLSAGYIDFDTYIELMPSQIATFKESLKKSREEGNLAQLRAAQENITALQEQIAQYQTYLEQMNKELQAQGKTVDSVSRVIAENRKLNETLAALQEEYTAKINQANAIIGSQANANREVTQDAETMALMMAKSEQSDKQ